MRNILKTHSSLIDNGLPPSSSPNHVVLVAVDEYDPNEAEKSMAIIPPNNGAEIPAKGDEVVVGVAFWKLEPGSKRIGQFQNETGTIYVRIQVYIRNS
jgi:hypothetical protein